MDVQELHRIQSMGSSLLIEYLIASASEKASLIYTDSPLEELTNVQAKLDAATQELEKRMAW
jgi:hypothetical protein